MSLVPIEENVADSDLSLKDLETEPSGVVVNEKPFASISSDPSLNDLEGVSRDVDAEKEPTATISLNKTLNDELEEEKRNERPPLKV